MTDLIDLNEYDVEDRILRGRDEAPDIAPEDQTLVIDLSEGSSVIDLSPDDLSPMPHETFAKEPAMALELSPQQVKAIETIVPRLQAGEKLTYLAGFAGTGKSTILPNIIAATGIDPNDIAFLAPTGKAAKVMRNKLKAQNFPNWMATTIHSAIYRAKPAPIGTLEDQLYKLQTERQQVRENPNASGREAVVASLTKDIKRLESELNEAYVDDKVNFQLNLDSIIKTKKLIVVDEASMVGAKMCEDLMYFEVPILAMGDPGQLPPVQDEAGLTAGEPDVFLTEIHRQAADNPILLLATMAREGKPLKPGVYGDGRAVVMRRKDFNNPDHPNCFDWDGERPQFICGTNSTRWRLTRMLRAGYGIEGKGPQSGEPLIVKKNSKDHPNLVNGAEVISLMDAALIDGQATFPFAFEDPDDGRRYDAKAFQGLFEEHYSNKKGGFTAQGGAAFRSRKNSVELDWSYVITGHSSQGSQWDHVVVIDESGVFKADSEKWLYTALTRAAKTLTVLV